MALPADFRDDIHLLLKRESRADGEDGRIDTRVELACSTTSCWEKLTTANESCIQLASPLRRV